MNLNFCLVGGITTQVRTIPKIVRQNDLFIHHQRMMYKTSENKIICKNFQCFQGYCGGYSEIIECVVLDKANV